MHKHVFRSSTIKERPNIPFTGVSGRRQNNLHQARAHQQSQPKVRNHPKLIRSWLDGHRTATNRGRDRRALQQLPRTAQRLHLLQRQVNDRLFRDDLLVSIEYILANTDVRNIIVETNGLADPAEVTGFSFSRLSSFGLMRK